MFTLSRDGYAKRVSLRSYNASSDSLCGLKEGDRLIGCGEVSTLDKILFFTNMGTYGYVPVYELEEAKWKDVGTHLNAGIRMRGEEKITDAFVVKSFQSQAYVVSVTRMGLIKKSALSEYEVSRNNKTMSNMKLLDGDEVIRSFITYDGDEIFIASETGFAVRYPLDMVCLLYTSHQQAGNARHITDIQKHEMIEVGNVWTFAKGFP